MRLDGRAVSSGIGIGEVCFLKKRLPDYQNMVSAGEQEEKARLQVALRQFSEGTKKMADLVTDGIGSQEADIFLGQLEMAEDPYLLSLMNGHIEAGLPAEAAVVTACNQIMRIFSESTDEILNQRVSDLRDLKNLLLDFLTGEKVFELPELREDAVLAAEDFTPTMLTGVDRMHVAGILSQSGGFTSHTAILARQMGIPAVFGIPDLEKHLEGARIVCLDGFTGRADIDPDEDTYTEWIGKRKSWQEEQQHLLYYKKKPTVDAEGNRYDLYCNIMNANEVPDAAELGVGGIGLFRTEFLFMDRLQPPDEEEQYKAYVRAAYKMKGKPVTIRTLDAGGDKQIACLPMPPEPNPFMGLRGIRYSLREGEQLMIQLRALLRASAAHRNIRIMLPMVTCVEEIRAVRELLEQCKQELRGQGIAFDPQIPLGIMIETPAAAFAADILAKEADFFSIGTNDLSQYCMAADRGSPYVESLANIRQPSLLRAVHAVICAAKLEGIPVGLCGEAAADPDFLPVLMAWGLNSYSVSIPSLLSVRAHMAQISLMQARDLADQVLFCSTEEEVKALLQEKG